MTAKSITIKHQKHRCVISVKINYTENQNFGTLKGKVD